MKVKSLLLLLALAGCGKVAQVDSAIKDAIDIEDCDIVCTVDVAGDVTPAVEIAQSASPSEDATQTEDAAFDAVLKDMEKAED